MSAYFARQGHVCLDLLPGMRKEPRDRPLYHAIDQHWNEHGNTVAARLVAGFLIEEGLVGRHDMR